MMCDTCGNPTRKLELFLSVVDHCDACENGEVATEASYYVVTSKMMLPAEYTNLLAEAYYGKSTCFVLDQLIHKVTRVVKGDTSFVDTEDDTGRLWKFLWNCDSGRWTYWRTA